MPPVPVAPDDEAVVAIANLIQQVVNDDTSPLSRVMATITARTYLESLTRRLVGEAREAGSTWEEIGVLFGTSAVNAKARFGDYHDYDD